jgi:hypothetical protein
LAARFATKVNALGVEDDRVQAALNNGDDPLWGAVESALVVPKVKALKPSTTVIVPRISRIEVLSKTPKPCAQRSLDDQVFNQKIFYKTLGWTFADFGLTIPPRRSGFDRLLVMANPNLTNNTMCDVLEESFRCWWYVKNLNRVIPKENDERHPSRGPYAIWVRDCVEADEVHRNKSASTIREEDIKTLTALERMYLEALVYHETCKHLDQDNWTLCSGSRDSDGNVPCAIWNDKFQIDKFLVEEEYPNFRARQVIAI